MLGRYYQYRRWNEIGRNTTGGLGVGCVVYLIWIPLTAIVLAIIGLFEFFSNAVMMIYGEYISQIEPVFNNLLFKLFFYPSTFDSIHNLFVNHPFINLFVLLIVLSFLTLIFKFSINKIFKVYLAANLVILTLRFLYILGITLLPLTMWEYLSDEEVALINYNVDIIEDKQINVHHDTYTLSHLQKDYDLTGVDLWEDKINRLTIRFGPNIGQDIANPQLEMAFDLSRGDVLSHVKFINQFETILIYTPTEETTQSDLVTLQLIGDGKVLNTYKFGAEPQMIPIDLKVDLDKSLILTINGQVEHSATIALVGSKFSYEFRQK